MLLLALDTSSAAVTVAVHDGSAVLGRRSVLDPRRHAELAAPLVRAVLHEAGVDRRELTGVVVGVGPGPFTGLRVGLVTARVLGRALDVPVHGLCSLDALAAATKVVGELVVVTDARRREVYWARYRCDGDVPERLDGPHVGDAAAVPHDAVPVTGRGCVLYPQLLGESAGPLEPEAGALARLAVHLLARDPRALLAPEPLYLRRPDARAPGARKRVLS